MSGLPVLQGAGGRAIAADAPRVALAALDQLWFQVSGTVCNLRCTHCFISCAPDNHSFWFMSREQVREQLDASVRLGVKEYYFTGGEPFMNRDLLAILEDTLALGPATVLTNGTLLTARTVAALAALAAATPYSLELRVSLDGVTEAANDAIRGAGSFRRAVGGIERLAAAGFLPIVTAMQSWDDAEGEAILAAFRELLASVGYDRARLKILPPLRIGAEAERSHGYEEEERVTHEMLHGFDLDQLLCSRARLVSARGIHACPILLDSPAARLGDSLEESTRMPVLLADQACYTCYVSGAICSNMPSAGRHLQ
jgi:AdoMet-dependent heme synthase